MIYCVKQLDILNIISSTLV